MRLRMMSLALAAALPLSAPVWAATELQGGVINFKGTVVGLPCLIETGNEVIEVDFGQIGMRDLYAEDWAVKPFTINLKDCATAVSNAVTVTFTGDATTEDLPGYLAIKSAEADDVKGIAIGFREADAGAEIPLNQESAIQQITGETLAMNYEAIVKASPSAIGARSLTTGSFTATANYTLNYQ